MGLYEKLKFAVAQNSHDENTLASYWSACRKFFAFCGKPASQWTGPDVERWLVHLHDQNYSRSSRKNALCAMAYVFKHVLKADMGNLDLPPMPRVRQTLRQELLGHESLETTAIYLHGDVARGVSPLDVMARPAPVLVNLGGLLE